MTNSGGAARSGGPLPRARWALTALPLAMAGALIATLLSSYGTVTRVLTAVTRGQGEVLLQAVRRAVPPGMSWNDEVMQHVLGQFYDSGLRCVAAFNPQGELLAEAGACPPPENVRPQLQAARPDYLLDLGNKLRLVARHQRPQPRPDQPPPERADSPPPVRPDPPPVRPGRPPRPGSSPNGQEWRPRPPAPAKNLARRFDRRPPRP